MSASEEMVERVAETLDTHRCIVGVDEETGIAQCLCGESFPILEGDYEGTHNLHVARAVLAALDLPEATERVEWGISCPADQHTVIHWREREVDVRHEAAECEEQGDRIYRRTVTTEYTDVCGPWEQVDQ